MHKEYYLDKIIEQYLADDTVPQRAYIALEEAQKVFGKQAVSLEVGFSNYDESLWKEKLHQHIRTIGLPTSITREYRGHFTVGNILDDVDKYHLLPSVMCYVAIKLRNSSYNCWSRLALLIYIPKTTITNEHNKSIQITDLFVRVPLNDDGTVRLSVFYARTSYTTAQWLCGYRHSHTPSFARNEADMFSEVCTGDGPINNTLRSLHVGINADNPIIWGLLFWELSKIIKIESEHGGPYIYMNSVGVQGEVVDTSVTLSDIFYHDDAVKLVEKFLPDYISYGRFKVAFQNGGFCLPTSTLEWIMDFSNLFFVWAANNGHSTRDYEGILEDLFVLNNKVVKPSVALADEDWNLLKTFKNKVSIRFKGVDFSVYITDVTNTEGAPKAIKVINRTFCVKILYILLQILNYKYGKKQEIFERNCQGYRAKWYEETCKSPSILSKKIRIL